MDTNIKTALASSLGPMGEWTIDYAYFDDQTKDSDLPPALKELLAKPKRS